MKEKYESPVLEIFSFGVRDAIMNIDQCTSYNGGGCSLNCLTDGHCIMDTGMGCIMDDSSSL